MRQQFDGCEQLIESREWGEVRQLVTKTVTLMTLKGYRGASVKSRALEMKDDSLLDARAGLLKALGALDKLAYEQQQKSPFSSASKAFDPSEAVAEVRESTAKLDLILKKLS